MPVNTPHEDYQRAMPEWQKLRDVLAGQAAVRRQAAQYLRRPPGMSFEEFDAYADAATFMPATGRTLAGLTGAIFRKAPIINASNQDLIENIDQRGTPFAVFAKATTNEVIAMGRHGVLVDVPSKEGGQPYLARYTAENIINWRSATVNGKPTLTMVVLKEIEARPREEDRFTTDEVEQYRLLELIRTPDHSSPVYAVSVFERRREDTALIEGPIVPLRRGEPLTFIPFEFIGPTDLQPGIEQSPLLGLADTNIAHYRTSAEYENSLFFAGFPIFVIAGDMPTSGIELRAGSGMVWQLEKGATAQVLQGSAENVGALREALDRKAQDMAILGARLLEPQKAGVESAEAIGLRHRGESATLASIADTVGRGLSRVLTWAMWWAGEQNADATVQLNTDFIGAPMSGAEIVQFVSAWQTGGLPLEALHHSLARGEALPEGMTLDKYREGLENDGPAAAFLGPEPDDDE